MLELFEVIHAFISMDERLGLRSRIKANDEGPVTPDRDRRRAHSPTESPVGVSH